MGTGQGKLPQELVTDNALLKRKYESEELGGAEPVFAIPSESGLEIQDGSDTRSFLTAEMSGGVPTGNFS